MKAGDSLETLLTLQELDVRLAGLAERSGQLPRIREEVSREITALEVERAERTEALERIRLERRGHESELETHQEHLKRYERQLNEVKTNVAYSALLTEIQGTKRAISGLEEQILELMEERETVEARLAAIAEELEEKRTASEEELRALDAEAVAIEREMAGWRSRRDQIAGQVPPVLYRMYDRLRRGRRFPALVPLRGTACGACYGRMTPQVVREINHDGALHACENCGVLVYAAAEAGTSGGTVQSADAR